MGTACHIQDLGSFASQSLCVSVTYRVVTTVSTFCCHEHGPCGSIVHCISSFSHCFDTDKEERKPPLFFSSHGLRDAFNHGREGRDGSKRDIYSHIHGGVGTLARVGGGRLHDIHDGVGTRQEPEAATQSGSRERWMLVLSSLPPFYSVCDLSPGNGAAHIQHGSSHLS